MTQETAPEPTVDVGQDPLMETMRRLGEEAARRGLTQDLLDAELAQHKLERQR